MQTPDTPDETLTFPALQTYEGGEVVRWIGDPDAEEPAPTVALAAAEEEHGGVEEETASEPPEEDGNGIAIAALVVGGLALATGGASLLRNRNGS